jgi:predicted nucleic acid-binding Zn ribbon protein
MPIYDYICPQCHHYYTRTVAVEDRDAQLCMTPDPDFTGYLCGSTLVRQPAVPHLHFKGGGWTPKHHWTEADFRRTPDE